MTIKKLLMLGFGSMILIMALVSIIATVGMQTTYSGFVDYRQLARSSNSSAQVVSNLLSMRLAVLGYLSDRLRSDGSERLQAFNQENQQLKSALNEINDATVDNRQRGLVMSSNADIQTYEQDFLRVQQLYDDRDRLVKDNLDLFGLSMRKEVTSIIATAYADDDIEAAYLAGVFQESLLLARLYVTKFLLSNSGADLERALFELESEMPKRFTELQAAIQNPARLERLAEVDSLHQRYVTAFKETKEVIDERNSLINNSLNTIGPRVAQNMEKLQLSIKRSQDTLGPELQGQARLINYLIMGVALFSLLGAVLISRRVIKQIYGPIGGEPAKIEEVVETISQGDFTGKVELGGQVSGIYRSIMAMSGKLSDVIKSLSRAGDDLVQSAAASANIATKNEQTLELQREQAEQCAAAIEEMSATIRQVAGSAKNGADVSEEGKSKTAASRHSVTGTVSAINSLSESLQHSSGAISDLEKRGKEIGTVVEVIQDIAEQTNLLALNAAIEAARAGEQGKGFAVVSGEVLALSQQTAESTTKIQAIIQSLQKGTEETVKKMAVSNQIAQDAVSRSKETDSALSEVYDIMERIVSLNSEVATAVQQQSEVANSMAKSMSTISNGLGETSDSATEIRQRSDEVRRISETVGTITARFKVA
ncbi:MAG: methyl-accepting chemotaxis protein [Pseudomonadota bacterium]